MNLDNTINDVMNIVTMPQYSGTCWFNTFLTNLLYSQYSRNLLQSKKHTWDNNDFTSLIIDIIDNYYEKNREKNYILYFYLNKPQNIIKTLYDVYNIDKKDINIPQYKPMINGHSISKYSTNNGINFLLYINNILDIPSIMFCINNDKLFYSYYNFKNVNRTIIKNTQKIDENHIKITAGKLKTKLKSNYDVIFVTINNSTIYPGYEMTDIYLNNDIIQDIKKLEYIILFNNNLYILDSSIYISLQNAHSTSHAISCLTHNNEQYIYDPDTLFSFTIKERSKKSDDTGVKSNKKSFTFRNARDLIKYNWWYKNMLIKPFKYLKISKCDIYESDTDSDPEGNYYYTANTNHNSFKYVKLSENDINELLIKKPSLSKKITMLKTKILSDIQQSFSSYISPPPERHTSVISDFAVSPNILKDIEIYPELNNRIYDIEYMKRYILYKIDNMTYNNIKKISDIFPHDICKRTTDKILPKSFLSSPDKTPSEISPSRSKISPSPSKISSPLKKKLRV